VARTALAAIQAAARLGLLAPPPEPPRCELRVRGRLHSRARDQAVIAGHYDVPSAFYQLILDPSMAYSCAYWDGTGPETRDLAAAQHAKLELIRGKLTLEPGQTLLDMGCGWGSLTIHAARARVRVTGVTLSREQGGYVRQRARGLGLAADRVDVRIQDYRDPLDAPGGGYDAVASVEMGEHVGAAGYPAFCAALYRKLRPGGRLLIQQMSRDGRAPGGGPFIESYIAPDMDMRPVGETISLIQDAGFEVIGIALAALAAFGVSMGHGDTTRRALGTVRHQPGLVARAACHRRAAADDRHPDPRHRSPDDRPADDRAAAAVRRLRRPDQRLHPAAAPSAVIPQIAKAGGTAHVICKASIGR